MTTPTNSQPTTPPPKPVPIDVVGAEIPEELRKQDRWVIWRYLFRDGRWTKPPFQTSGWLASSTDKKTWASFDSVMAAYVACVDGRKNLVEGIGFVLDEDLGIVGVDLDHCVDPVTGKIEAWAQKIADDFNCYTEVSPSGTGLRLIFRGELPDTGHKKGGVEVYQTGRYLTITGHRLVGTPSTIEERQPQLDAFLAEFFPDSVKPKTPVNQAPRPAFLADVVDALIVDKASNARNGAKFKRLWDGSTDGYKSHSEADAALCRLLAFFCNGDAGRIDQLFRQSGLMTEKWEKRAYYRDRTIRFATAGMTTFYDWDRRGSIRMSVKKTANAGGQPGVNGAAAGQDDAEEEPHAALERDDDPHRLARLFLSDYLTEEGHLAFRYWREEWWHWNGHCYVALGNKHVRALVTARVKKEFDEIATAKLAAYLKAKLDGGGDDGGDGDSKKDKGPPVAQPITVVVISNVLQAVVSLSILPDAVDQPSWVAPPFWTEVGFVAPAWDAGQMLACRNTLVNLPSEVAGDECLMPHTPAFFSPNALGYDYDPSAPDPVLWLDFLDKLWANDAHAILVLQEVIGYLLTPDTSQQKIFMMIGPKRSGKGTIARLLRRLIGEKNMAGPTLSGLGGNFGLQPLLGKMLAIISDARLTGRTDAAVVVERLLALSGEDGVTVERKHMTSVTTQLSTRFLILTNELPRLSDSSGALVGRLVLLRLTESFYGREDSRLTDKLAAELSGILNWAIRGWARLNERGHFEQPASGQSMLDDMDDLASPIKMFIRERCELDAGYEVFVRDLYHSWSAWCVAKGKRPGTEQVFGRDLRAALPHLGTRQPRTGDGRVRLYIGIRLRQENYDGSNGTNGHV